MSKDKNEPKEQGAKEEPLVDVDVNLSKLSPRRISQWYQGLSKGNKIIVTVFASFIMLLIVFIPAAFLLKLDSIVFPSTLEGTITQYTGDPVEGAKVCVGNKCDTSNSEGEYSLGGLTYGKREISVRKEGYYVIEEDINIKRGENKKFFELKIQGMKNVAGKFSVEGQELITTGFTLVSADKSYVLEVEEDGTFLSKNLEIPDMKITLSSPNYMDVLKSFDPSESEIDMGEIVLVPAGDVTFKPVDFISLEYVNNIKVEPKTVVAGQELEVEINESEGKVTIKDLKIGESLEFKVSKDNYNVKNVTVAKVQQGENEQKSFELVRAGKFVYISSRTGNTNIYIANYDGSEEKMLTGNKGNNTSPYYSVKDNVVYFVSDRDKQKNKFGSIQDLVYKVNLSNLGISKVSQTKYDETGYIGTYNLKAMKRLVIREHPDYPNTWQVFFGNIDGTGSKQIFHSADGLYNFALSDSGNLLMYAGRYSDSSKDGIYLYNAQTGKQNRIYEINEDVSAEPVIFSPDGKYALIQANINSQSDLVVRNFAESSSTQVTTNATYELYGRFNPDSTKVSYISSRDGKSDIYTVDLDGKNEKKITTDGKVSNYIWAGNLIFYVSEGKLWVTDSEKPDKSRKVSDSGQISDYFNFGYYYGWD